MKKKRTLLILVVVAVLMLSCLWITYDKHSEEGHGPLKPSDLPVVESVSM